MKVISSGEMENRRGPEDRFTGEVWMESASVPRPGAGFFRVSFGPEARTNWHTHPEGQVLYIITGNGRVGREDGAVVEVRPGDVVHFAPGEKHWHGAAPGNSMVHFAVSPAVGTDGGTEWLEPVTDEQYSRRAPGS